MVISFIHTVCILHIGKYAPQQVMILPLDLTSGEDVLRKAVQEAESFFDGAGVDYMIHNAAYERPVMRYKFNGFHVLFF